MKEAKKQEEFSIFFFFFCCWGNAFLMNYFSFTVEGPRLRWGGMMEGEKLLDYTNKDAYYYYTLYDVRFIQQE